MTTYKTKLRPLIRHADLYHVFPRPDGKRWDGIEYYDPVAKKGVVYLFKPAAQPDTMTIRLRGLPVDTRYRVTFEDGSNPAGDKRGDELTTGIDVTLKGEQVSELLCFEEIAQRARWGIAAHSRQLTSVVSSSLAGSTGAERKWMNLHGAR